VDGREDEAARLEKKERGRLGKGGGGGGGGEKNMGAPPPIIPRNPSSSRHLRVLLSPSISLHTASKRIKAQTHVVERPLDAVRRPSSRRRVRKARPARRPVLHQAPPHQGVQGRSSQRRASTPRPQGDAAAGEDGEVVEHFVFFNSECFLIVRRAGALAARPRPPDFGIRAGRGAGRV
jgi:hypothetical protein